MITGSFHTGLTVADTERALALYRDILGFEVLMVREASDEYLQTLVGAPGVTLLLTHLGIPNSQHQFELLEYRGVERNQLSARPRDLGASHIALYVDNLPDLYASLVCAGYRTMSEVVGVTGGRFTGGKILYFQDADGYWIELIEPPAGYRPK